jgi:hypothetical protein
VGPSGGDRRASSAAQSQARKDGGLMLASMFSERSTLALFS